MRRARHSRESLIDLLVAWLAQKCRGLEVFGSEWHALHPWRHAGDRSSRRRSWRRRRRRAIGIAVGGTSGVNRRPDQGVHPGRGRSGAARAEARALGPLENEGVLRGEAGGYAPPVAGGRGDIISVIVAHGGDAGCEEDWEREGRVRFGRGGHGCLWSRLGVTVLRLLSRRVLLYFASILLNQRRGWKVLWGEG